MALFIIYDIATGRVRGTGQYSDSTTDAQVTNGDSGLAVLRGEVTHPLPRFDEIWVESGEVVPIDQADPATVEAALTPEAITAAVARVNGEAAGILGSVASPHAPQVAIYEAKQAEAIACQAVIDAGGTPDGADYPLLEAGKSVDGRTLAEEAAAVLGEAAQWKQAGAAVDAVRRAANKAIGQATTRAEVQAVLDALTWPDLGL